MDEEDFPVNLDHDLLKSVFDEFDDLLGDEILEFSDDDMWFLRK